MFSHGKQTLEEKYEWSRKGKKYKTKYFCALKELFGEIKNDTDCHEEAKERCTTRKLRTD